MKICYILRGVPGSGKSTYAKHLVRNGGVIHSTDDYFTVDGVYKHVASRVSEFHDYNFANFCKSIKRGVERVVVDNTNIRIIDFDRYRAVAHDNGYIVEVLEFRAEPADAWRRNVHGVPYEKIVAMEAMFEPTPQYLLESLSVPRP